jgi:hypothetical protein
MGSKVAREGLCGDAKYPEALQNIAQLNEDCIRVMERSTDLVEALLRYFIDSAVAQLELHGVQLKLMTKILVTEV